MRVQSAQDGTAMVPSKFASPTFAVTAAILGGIALAVSTCQGAVIRINPLNAMTLTSEYDPVQRWVVSGIHPGLFQDYDRERTINRYEFIVPTLELTELTSAVLTFDIDNFPSEVSQYYLRSQSGYAFLGSHAVAIGDPWDWESGVRANRTWIYTAPDPPNSAEITIDLTTYLRSEEFARRETDILTLDYSAYTRPVGPVTFSNPRLIITTIPEPSPMILLSISSLVLFRRRV
jgi:hypothetical protein